MVKITVMRKTVYDDLIKEFENPIENACNIKVGQTFYCDNLEMPNGFCDSAWDTLKPFISELLNGGGNFYGGWMKNEKSAMLSCNDGFRPVSFLIEVI
ncbi:MAG: TIGR04076 family protein [Clostridia bacterium]|nr:TIGR04076 family protein [Clostridia bacterium]